MLALACLAVPYLVLTKALALSVVSWDPTMNGLTTQNKNGVTLFSSLPEPHYKIRCPSYTQIVCTTPGFTVPFGHCPWGHLNKGSLSQSTSVLGMMSLEAESEMRVWVQVVYLIDDLMEAGEKEEVNWTWKKEKPR